MAVAAPSNVLYVGNLPKGTSKISLEHFLQPYGVMRINVREGYGIAEMNSVSEAQRAINVLNGHDFNGQPLAVRFKAQPQHKQFRQVNNNNHHSGPGNKDGGKNFSPHSPSGVIQPQQQQQDQFFSDISSPQSANLQQQQQQQQTAEVRTVQVGLRGLQITTTNNLAQQQQKHQMQLEQELKNVAFLPDSEKVRQLEQLVQLQQNKINKLEARLEEIMEAANKQLQQNGQAINRPNVMLPAGAIPMQMHHQAQLPQQQHNGMPGANHFNAHPQFSQQQQFYGAQIPQQQQTLHWQPAAAYPAPTGQFYANADQQPQQQVGQPGYNVPPPLMMHPQAKMGHPNGGFDVTGAYLPGYPQSMPLTPVDALNNCFFPGAGPNGQVGPIPMVPGVEAAFHPHAHHAHPIPPQHHRNGDFGKHGDNHLNNGAPTNNQGNHVANRFNNGNNGPVNANNRNNINRQQDNHRNGGFGVNNQAQQQQQQGQNRPLRGNNRQNGYQQRSNNHNNEKNKLKAANASVVSNENKAPNAVTSPTSSVEESPTSKVIEGGVCPRCQKSIPENLTKCPDCRSSNTCGSDEQDEKDASSVTESGLTETKTAAVVEAADGGVTAESSQDNQ